MILGIAGTVYQAVLLRLYLPVQDRLQRQNLGGLGERNMALREVLAGMEDRTPKDAVVQYNTDQPRDFFNFAQLLNTPRQTVPMRCRSATWHLEATRGHVRESRKS